MKDTITSEVLGEYPDFIGIYPDGSISVVRREQPDSTIGLTIETIDISEISLTITTPPTGGMTLTTQDEIRFQAVAYDLAGDANGGV